MADNDTPRHCDQESAVWDCTTQGRTLHLCLECGAFGLAQDGELLFGWTLPKNARWTETKAECGPQNDGPFDDPTIALQIYKSQAESEMKMLRRQHDIMLGEIKSLHGFDKWTFNAIAELRGSVRQLQKNEKDT